MQWSGLCSLLILFSYIGVSVLNSVDADYTKYIATELSRHLGSSHNAMYFTLLMAKIIANKNITALCFTYAFHRIL